mgnify:CR=1 FL=1
MYSWIDLIHSIKRKKNDYNEKEKKRTFPPNLEKKNWIQTIDSIVFPSIITCKQIIKNKRFFHINSSQDEIYESIESCKIFLVG